MIQDILSALIGSVGYSIVFYFKSIQKRGQSFSIVKFTTTLIVGEIIALGSILTNSPLTQEQFETQILAYGFLTAVVESVLKGIVRRIRRLRG